MWHLGTFFICRHLGTVPYCRQKRNVPKCRLSPTLEVTADGVDHTLGRGLAEHVGCGIGVHKDVHERLQGLDLAARLGDARLMTICAGTGAPMPAIALNVTGAAGFTTAI